MGLEKNQERVEVMFLAIDPSGSMIEKRTFACEVPSLALAGLKAQSGATGGKGAFTQWAHCEFIVGFETICPANTHWANYGFF